MTFFVFLGKIVCYKGEMCMKTRLMALLLALHICLTATGCVTAVSEVSDASDFAADTTHTATTAASAVSTAPSEEAASSADSSLPWTTTVATTAATSHSTQKVPATTVSQKPATTTSTVAPANHPDKEMRGIWVSFLDLDPLLEDASPAQAQKELDRIMDNCVAMKLNTVFFHVRSHANAYYPSRVYPAADTAAQLLKQGFDPLAYAVESAHKRGLQLHAWINPYRMSKSRPADPTGCFEKEGVWYADPGSARSRQRVLDGIREILQAYPVDGIHFDDYFYPAGMAPQGESFEAIPAGTEVIAWRQTQVDTLVSAAYSLCRQHNRLFGISPAGSVEHCRTKACAAVDRWAAQPGYVDYLCPQIYTGFEHDTRPFDAVLPEWLALPRDKSVRLYVGLALYKAGLANDRYAGSGRQEWSARHDIISRQLRMLRPLTGGFVLFRYRDILGETPALQQELSALKPLL